MNSNDLIAAILLGDAEAQFRLAYNHWTLGDSEFAIKYFMQSAMQGYAKAQFCLGLCYYDGDGVSVDTTEAVEWWQKAAEQGLAEAQFKLGDCYYLGEGILQDEKKALEWYQKAAAQGNEDAKKALEAILK